MVGYTNRVAKMLTVFEEIGHGQFKRDSHVNKLTNNGPVTNGTNNLVTPLSSSLIAYNKNGTPKIRGEVVIVHDHIQLIDVPIVTPNCDIVVSSLTIKVFGQVVPNNFH